MDLKINLKHYWIFLVTIIFYCIGFAVHFIAQHSGTHPSKGVEVLRENSPKIDIVNEIKNEDVTDVIENGNNESKYSKPDNLFYFLQVSDIHMSDKYTRGAQGHLYYLLKKMIPVIEPNFLFITGDITDSMKGINIGTVENDWKMYRKIIETTGINDKNNGTFLWDLRGNHDCFMVPEWSSKYNYFKDYSQRKTRGFTFNYQTSYGTYSFAGLDGCPVYSTTNPFFGIVDEVSMDMYTKFMDNNIENPNNKHNFVLIHFPETTVKFSDSSSGKEWEDYTKYISLLLTGHFHNLGGYQMYAYHHDFLELEIIDFKLHGRYRIVSVDNDIVSITDNFLPLPTLPYDFKTSNIDDLINNPPEIFNQDIPPIVHITSPKNSRFILKDKEPVKESLSSGYIRVLVFSSQSPNDLKLSLYIDDKLQEVEFKYVGDKKLERRSNNIINIVSRDNKDQSSSNEIRTVDQKTPPLWIAEWDNSKYNDGKSHSLKVIATDNKNLKGENMIQFRLDGKSDDLGISSYPQFVLRSVFVKTLPILFGIVFIIYELMLILPRLYAVRNIIPNHSKLPFLPNKYIGDIISNETKSFQNNFFKKHFILPFIEAFTLDGIFYPLQILAICLLVFPAKVGVVTRSSEHVSKIGGEFLYGLYGSGQWANIFDQYGLDLLFFILIPFVDTLIIVFANHKRRHHICVTIIILIILILKCIIQLIICIAISYVSGGIMAVFFSPFPTWNCIYCWVLIFIIVIRRIRYHDDKPVSPELSAAVQV